MTLTQLRYFAALSDQLHYNKTAELLYISQPSLTQHISKLEKELGVPLFRRGKDGLSLTPAGAAMQREVKVILGRLDNLVRALKDHPEVNLAPAVLRIAVDDYTFFHEEAVSEAFISTIKEINSEYPLAEIRTESYSPGTEYKRRLYDGSVDLFLGMLEDPGDPRLVCVHFCAQKQYLALPGEVPLQQTGNRERVAEYLNHNYLFMADYDHRMEVKILDFLVEKGISANMQFMSNILQILLAVRLGKGAAVIPEHRIMPEVFGDIQLVPLETLSINRYLIWSKDSVNPLLFMFTDRFQAEIERRQAFGDRSDLASAGIEVCQW